MPVARILDRLLEATIVPGFSRIGPLVRRRLEGWTDPTADLTGKVAVVTGSSGGIGREVAAELARLGATVWVTSRSDDRARSAADEIAAAAAAGATVAHAVDTGELAQVRAFAARLRAETDGIDLLVHNAGALTPERHETSQGIEATLAAHLVGPYLLTRELEDHLSPGARVLWMSSGGMYTQPLVVSRLEMDDDYSGTTAYARAKRAQVVLAGLLAEEYLGRAIVHAMHPGWAATDGVSAGLPLFDKVMGPILRTAEEAADTMVWLATADEPSRSSGDFWHDRRRRSTTYVPRTATTDRQRAKLVPWLDQRIATADATSTST